MLKFACTTSFDSIGSSALKNVPRLAQRGVLAVAVLLLSSAVAHAATYYVRTDGNDGNDGSTNTSGGAWRTINWAVDHASAGDVVRVQTGTYSERVSPGVSGSAGEPDHPRRGRRRHLLRHGHFE